MSQFILVAVMWNNLVSMQSFYSLEACEKAKAFMVSQVGKNGSSAQYASQVTCIKDTK